MFKIRCPAKLNTYLNVLKTRDDGYHEISSNLQLINLFDEISFERSKEMNLICNENDLENRNIIIDAINWFNLRYTTKQTFNINLQKNIPSQSGLGGGSSNAAYTLIFLCTINNVPIESLDLDEISRKIGADVPFFINSKSCNIFGIGEKIGKNVSSNDNYLLISPDIKIKTLKIFSSHSLQPLNRIDHQTNDLLIPLLSESKEFKKIFIELEKIVEDSEKRLKLSGSGSSVFIINPSEEEKLIFKQKKYDNFRIFNVKGLKYYDFVSDWGVAKW